jgi:Kelch motif protein
VWMTDGQMAENRSGQTATLLLNGSILVAGGLTGNTTIQTAEILDPVTHAFTSLGNMQVARNQQTDTLLPNGKVLLAAGSTDAIFLNSAELFDPSTNLFTPTGSMATARKSHTATLLQDNNRVLITGGKSATGDLASAEIYDSSTGQFSVTSSMNDGRSLHTATLLPNGVLTFPPGSVLVAGGRNGPNPLNTAEIFNPVTNTFTFTGMLNIQRKRHAANLLLDGTVFVEGGASESNGQPVDQGTPTAEIYNITGTPAGTWSIHPPQDMSTGRTEHTATLLSDGTVLVSGGVSSVLPSDLYNPATQTFSPTGGLLHQRQRHISLLLTNPAWGSLVGQVLAIGGAYTGSPVFGGIQVALDTVEIYNPATGQFTFCGTMTQPRQNHTATMLNDGRILIAGGVSSPAVSGTAELFTPSQFSIGASVKQQSK